MELEPEEEDIAMADVGYGRKVSLWWKESIQGEIK